MLKRKISNCKIDFYHCGVVNTGNGSLNVLDEGVIIDLSTPIGLKQFETLDLANWILLYDYSLDDLRDRVQMPRSTISYRLNHVLPRISVSMYSEIIKTMAEHQKGEYAYAKRCQKQENKG